VRVHDTHVELSLLVVAADAEQRPALLHHILRAYERHTNTLISSDTITMTYNHFFIGALL
jgi:hypothetical protein